MARIALDELPDTVPGQPQTGFLSFFDGYHLADSQFDWSPTAEYVRVNHDDGRELRKEHFPGLPEEYEFHDHIVTNPQYLQTRGPCWTAPLWLPEAPGQTRNAQTTWEAWVEFGGALRRSRLEEAVGQLFGIPEPIQDAPTPNPSNLDSSGYSDTRWDHLATFHTGVFDHYFSVIHGDLVTLTFKNIQYEAQCD